MHTFLGAPFRMKGRTYSSFGAPDATFSFAHSSSHSSMDLRGTAEEGLRRRLGAEGGVPEGRPRMRRRWFRPDRRRNATPAGGASALSSGSGDAVADGSGRGDGA
jgi:hypothetical protein